MISGRKILLINCSFPNYNLAIEKMKIYYGERAVEVRTVMDLFHQDYDGVCLSVIFSWDVPYAIEQAKIALAMGRQVMIGGGITVQLHNYIKRAMGIEPHYKIVPELENVEGNFKMVYFTRGCVQKCFFCPVPRIEGHVVTLNRKSNPAKVLMDNNLSQIPAEYQEYIVERYLAAGMTSVDCNSGFEPQGIDERTVKLFDRLPLRWWRMGFDEIGEEAAFAEAVRTIKAFSKKTVRAYTMIGHEPVAKCLHRLQRTIALGCEPVPQAYIKLDAKTKTPAVQHDWTAELLRDVQRFYYSPQLWRKLKLEDYVPRINGKIKLPVARRVYI
jgi:hypothetical protein